MDIIIAGAPLYWEIVPDQTTADWLQLQQRGGSQTANVKRDGCIDIQRWDLLHEGVHHICSIAAELRMLTDLRFLARQHFGPDWEE